MLSSIIHNMTIYTVPLGYKMMLDLALKKMRQYINEMKKTAKIFKERNTRRLEEI